jgi:predicted RNase H-like HicB family nuclease
MTMLVKMEAYHDGEFWCARGLGEDIFTQGETLDELLENIKEAVALHLEEIEGIAPCPMTSAAASNRFSGT